jgi:hypothetical protein
MLSPAEHTAHLVPDYCEPLVAWRIWHQVIDPKAIDLCDQFTKDYVNGTVNGALRLGSSFGTIWEPYQPLKAIHHDSQFFSFSTGKIGQVDDTCLNSPCDHYEGGISFGCGIYGIKELCDFREYIKDLWSISLKLVVGQVALWGNIVVHERGYRAQYAYPKRLIYATENGPQLASSYGIPYEEDCTWKSVYQSSELWRNRYSFLSPNIALSTAQCHPTKYLIYLATPQVGNRMYLLNQSLFPPGVWSDEEEEKRKRE